MSVANYAGFRNSALLVSQNTRKLADFPLFSVLLFQKLAWIQRELSARNSFHSVDRVDK